MDIFEDPFEGVVPKGMMNMLLKRSIDSGIAPGLYLAQHKEISEDFRKCTYVNCWHLSEHESEAMWSLYADKYKGIAIVSTVNKLRDLLPQKVDVREVEYIDFNSDDISIVPPHFYKRSAFEYEKELRAVIRDEDIKASGLPITVNPNELIDKVVISPLSQPWFADVVESVCKKYECDFYVEKSNLSLKPNYAYETYGNIL